MNETRLAGLKGRTAGTGALRLAAWIALILILAVTLLPIWWVLRVALTTSSLLFSDWSRFLPAGPTLANFARVLGLMGETAAIAAGGSGQTFHFLLAMRNSILFTGMILCGQLAFGALAAYAFARLRFAGRDAVFFLFVTGLMVPGVVTLIPNFVLVHSLGWLNSFQGMAAPYFLMAPFSVFFLRQFMITIPRELEEAAILDGSGRLRILARIILPVSQSAVITLAIVVFFSTWNTFLWPYLVGTTENVRVLTAALVTFQAQTPQGSPDWTGLMAGTALGMIPPIIILLLAGRRVVESLQFSGLR